MDSTEEKWPLAYYFVPYRLVKHNDRLETTIVEMGNTVETEKKDISVLTKDTRKWENDLRILNEQIFELQNAKSICTGRLNQYEESFGEDSQKSEDERKKIKDLQKRLKELQAKAEDMEEALENTQFDMQHTEETKKNLSEKIAELNKPGIQAYYRL